MRLPLVEGWTLRVVGGDAPPELVGRVFPATVPGCVHLDLMAAGVIPDPYLDENEAGLTWIGRVDWRYETRFTVDAPVEDEVDVVALGLDTVATVTLNGGNLGHTRNMHRSYRLPAGAAIRTGENELAVTFTAPIDAVEQASVELGPRPAMSEYPFNALRKMACNFGWDWGPALPTAGIWRPIYLESWRHARLASVRPLTKVDGSVGLVRVHVDVARAAVSHGSLVVQASVGSARGTAEVARSAASATVEVTVEDVELWWPHGYGGQHLYPVAVTLADNTGPLDSWKGRLGFRTVELDTTPDAAGTPFTLRVNGSQVFARGVNWIPDDCFPSRIEPSRYRERLTQAKAANVNIIRVWGGGIYENDAFYDLCDELGVLVWQDFLFACAAYAEEEPLGSEVVAEARETVARLCPHPSLVLWNGCNENIWGYADWGWKERLAGRTWGWGYYTEILPSIVAELDPGRPYSPGSPYSMSTDYHPNDPAHGTTHVWDVWNQVDYTGYRAYRPRLVAEFGFQGPPTWATLTRSVHDRPLSSDSPGLLAHQKADDGNGKLARGLAAHLPPPASFDDWHWAMSLNQARAVALGIEHFRSLMPHCMGAIVWQLNDCWPATSWAAIDGGGRRKPLWYALRRSFADRLLTFQPRDGGLALVAVNDSAEPWVEDVDVTRHRFDGTVLADLCAELRVAPRSVATVGLPSALAGADDAGAELLVAGVGAPRALWQFAEDLGAALPAPELEIDVERVEGGYRLAVMARSYVRDLAVLVDRLDPDASVDDMLVTLLPGETVLVAVASGAQIDRADFADRRVLRSANQLVHAARPV